MRKNNCTKIKAVLKNGFATSVFTSQRNIINLIYTILQYKLIYFISNMETLLLWGHIFMTSKYDPFYDPPPHAQPIPTSFQIYCLKTIESVNT